MEGWIYIHALILENLMSLIEKAFFSGSGLWILSHVWFFFFFFFACAHLMEAELFIRTLSCSFPLIQSSLQGIQRTLTWAWIAKTVAGRDSRTRELLRMRKQETSLPLFWCSMCRYIILALHMCQVFLSLSLYLYLYTAIIGITSHICRSCADTGASLLLSYLLWLMKGNPSWLQELNHRPCCYRMTIAQCYRLSAFLVSVSR